MDLIIVESPTKAKTITKFLGPKYRVLSSYGHIRDLPKSELGVDTEHNFEPKYIIPTKARKTVSMLKKEAKEAKTIILATDEDREGEAIAFHLSKILDLGDKEQQRIVFHEITKQAIENALKNPRDIDMNLVNAQQGRRVLDRLVGYKLSPFLWKKIVKGLSAGRVQSVAVRLIVEREDEIKAFKPQEYYTIEAELQSREANAKTNFLSFLIKKDEKTIPKLGINTKKEADAIVKNLNNAEYKVASIDKKESRRNPLPPFTTSTLQQEASKRLRWPAKFTMSVAQKLYEKGHITYHRTDSLNLSEISLTGAKKFIEEKYGKNYSPGFARRFKTKSKGAQEAHEAIRPTYPNKEPSQLKLDDKQHRLYDLIWRKFIASQMSQAIFDSTSIDISAKNYTFRTTGQTLKFDGFLKVYTMKYEEAELPMLEKNEILELIKLLSNQHFTQPLPRYTEAGLIKILEENGIGRPSTYAPTISTIQTRNYVQKNEDKRFEPTEIGIAVNGLLVEHFPKIVDIKFTAIMEKNFDEIAEGETEWTQVIENFYTPFAKNLANKEEEVPKHKIAEQKTDKICPKCGAPLIIKLGRFGKFYACSAFPECKHTAPLERPSLGVKCPKCEEGELVEKRTRKGKIFFACNKYPQCDFALWDKPINEKCPKCDSLLVETKKGAKCSNKECDYKR
jgi:DNA topoisomerase-1